MANQTSNNNEQIMKDLRIIANFDANINYSMEENIRTVLAVMEAQPLFSTVFGRRYQKRLQDMLDGNPYQRVCIFCGRENENGLPLCTECNKAVTGVRSANAQQKKENTNKNEDSVEVSESSVAVNNRPAYKPQQEEISKAEEISVENQTTSRNLKLLKTAASKIGEKTRNAAKGSKRKKVALCICAFLLVCVIVSRFSDKNTDKDRAANKRETEASIQKIETETPTQMSGVMSAEYAFPVDGKEFMNYVIGLFSKSESLYLQLEEVRDGDGDSWSNMVYRMKHNSNDVWMLYVQLLEGRIIGFETMALKPEEKKASRDFQAAILGELTEFSSDTIKEKLTKANMIESYETSTNKITAYLIRDDIVWLEDEVIENGRSKTIYSVYDNNHKYEAIAIREGQYDPSSSKEKMIEAIPDGLELPGMPVFYQTGKALIENIMIHYYNDLGYKLIYVDLKVFSDRDLLQYRLEKQNGEIVGFVYVHTEPSNANNEGYMISTMIALYENASADDIAYQHQIMVLENSAIDTLRQEDIDTMLRRETVADGDWAGCILADNILWDSTIEIEPQTGKTMICYGVYDLQYFNEKYQTYVAASNK